MGSALERLLGFAEGAVSAVERVLLVAPATDGLSQQLPSSVKCDAAQLPSSAKRNARRFCVLEVIEPTGELSWVVSNGYDRATCNSAAFAEKVKGALE